MTNKNINEILNDICKGIEAPKIKASNTDHEKERLIEHIEQQNYPYTLLHCEHREQMGIGEDCVACQLLQYETYKSRFMSLAKEKGYEHTHTLQAAFDYYSSLITQYRLTECDELLGLIYPFCNARGTWSIYYFMAIQALSFLRFKQGRYQESIDYFKKQIDIMGPNERIYENMALAHSRLNQYKEASICYANAILLIRQKPQEQQQFATLLLGLSAVLDNIDDSLVVLDASMDLLKTIYDKPHSLMAKTLTAMGDLHLKRQDSSAAEKSYAEAVTIFIDTCGYETPLTSNAMNKYARTLLLLDKKDKAMTQFLDALKVWAKVDNESFDPNMVVEALMALKNSSGGAESIPVLEAIQNKILSHPVLFTDLNVLCLLKFIYELYITNHDIPRAKICCKLFIDYLNKLDETHLKGLLPIRDQLLQESMEIANIMERM